MCVVSPCVGVWERGIEEKKDRTARTVEESKINGRIFFSLDPTFCNIGYSGHLLVCSRLFVLTFSSICFLDPTRKGEVSETPPTKGSEFDHRAESYLVALVICGG